MLTFGTIIAIVVLSICALAFLVGVFACIVGESPFGLGVIACAVVVAFIAQIGFMMVGYSGDYLHYHAVNGTVQSVASRQVADSNGGMSTRYVAQINGQPYGIDDTRAALIKPGDTVKLNCTKEFVWGSTNNGWACNWG